MRSACNRSVLGGCLLTSGQHRSASYPAFREGRREASPWSAAMVALYLVDAFYRPLLNCKHENKVLLLSKVNARIKI